MIKKWIFPVITLLFIFSNSLWFGIESVENANNYLWKISYHNKKKYEIIKKRVNNLKEKIWIRHTSSYLFRKNKLKIFVWKNIIKEYPDIWVDIINLNSVIKKFINNYWLIFIFWTKEKVLNNLKYIEQNRKNIKCNYNKIYIKKTLWDILMLKYNWIHIDFNRWDKKFNNLITCYLKDNLDKFIFKKSLVTRYHKYRKTNINLWLETFKWYYNIWDEINAFKHLKNNWNKYVDWYALFSSTWDSRWLWVVSKKVKAWWLCGVSTIIYQWLSNLQWFKVEKVYPHQSWWDTYYWTIRWIDSTVFFSDNMKYAYKNLIIKNYFWPIYLDYYSDVKKWKEFINRYWKKVWWWWFIYWVKLYSLDKPFKQYLVKEIKKYNKWKLECYKVWFFNKNWNLDYTRDSCYKTVNKKIDEEKEKEKKK